MGRLVSVAGRHDRRSIPIFPVPGLELPRRERLLPPLRHPVRPVSEPRFVLGLGRHHLPHDAPPHLAGRLADQIDEYRLVGHSPLPAKFIPARSQSAPGSLTGGFREMSGLRQVAVYRHPLIWLNITLLPVVEPGDPLEGRWASGVRV